MRRFVIMLGVLCGLHGAAVAEEGFESLFNGKDLTGWDGNPDLWSVQDGVIVGRAAGLKYNQFLVWSGTAADFELRLEFQLEGDNNSGVQYRSQERDTGKWAIKGYQADIHPNPAYCGMLYDEGGRGIIAQRGQKVTVNKDGQKDVSQLEVPVEPIDLSKWHELTIIARGPELIHKIDGVTTVEVVDHEESARDTDGLIALQIHVGKPMTVRFRNIRLKRLEENAAVDASSQGAAVPRARPRARQRQQAAALAAQPEWIWLQQDSAPARNLFLRKSFEIRGPVAAARLLVASNDALAVFFDGKKVADHDSEEMTYVDMAGHFQDEETGAPHVLAIEARNAQDCDGVLAQLEIESGFRDAWKFVSDGSWKASHESVDGWRKPQFDDGSWKPASVLARLENGPQKLTPDDLLRAARLRVPSATPVDEISVPDGFQVELLYSVPKEIEGSWVSMCVDPRGRLIVCDQYGGLFRVTPPGILGAKEIAIEPIDVPIGEAQGLLWAFDSLYVVVNKGGKYESGLYRVRDTNGDDQLDTLDTLRLLPGAGGEHGPHAILLSPDGQSLHIVCGNKVFLTEYSQSRVPELWDEDAMIPRLYGKGFMKGVPAPGGYICRVDPEGENWELVTVGFRNPYDAAFNADGELLTYDADMEWDMNTPWYRPTRVCHVLSGVDYGWRNGGAKFPEHFPDTLPPVVNIGPGSPTGVTFGYGARFPAKHQRALFLNDWSYGKIYAAHLEPRGASYTATVEDFVVGAPLPLTDIVVNPQDGALYFAIGGRRVQSGLYRVTYVGSESTEPVDARDEQFAGQRQLRRELEALHVGDHPQAVEFAWPHLASADRVLRTAARIAIEHRPAAEWIDRAIQEPRPQARLEALLALVRQQQRNIPGEPRSADEEPRRPAEGYAREAIDTFPPAWDAPSSGPAGAAGAVQERVLTALGQLDWESLTLDQKMAGLRVLQLAILRCGQPSSVFRYSVLQPLDTALPTGHPDMNAMVLDVLVNLQSSRAVEQGLALMRDAPSQEEQINYAKALRFARRGWTDAYLEEYFRWFIKAQGYRGGAGFQLFVDDIRRDALALLNAEQRAALQPILDAKPSGPVNPFAVEPRPVVREWTMEELLPLVESRLHGRSYENGRRMFGAANCFGCHRFNGEGGAMGPDLTSLAGRFNARDILESILEPSKVISDQYAAVQILTVSGQVITGRIVNLAGDTFRVNTNMLDPESLVGVDRKQIEEMVPSQTSMMPAGLLNSLEKEEILDLMAFLMSRGDRESALFGRR